MEGLEESKEEAGVGEEGEAYLFDLFLAIFPFCFRLMALFLFVRYYATGTNLSCAIAGRSGHRFCGWGSGGGEREFVSDFWLY